MMSPKGGGNLILIKYNDLIKACSSILCPATENFITQPSGNLAQPKVEQDVYEKVYFGKRLP